MKKHDHLPIFGVGPVYVVSIILLAMRIRSIADALTVEKAERRRIK